MRAPPLSLAPGTELRINGQLQVVRAVSSAGEVQLECPIRRTRLSFSLSELVALRMSGTLESVNSLPITHKPTGKPNGELPSTDVYKRIARRVAYAVAGAKEFPVGPASVRMTRMIAEIAARINDQHPPSPHATYRWIRRYVTSGYDTAVFMQDAQVTRTRRARKLTDEVSTALRDNIEALMSQYPGANLNGITNLALAKTAKAMGCMQFVTKEGSTELVDGFILVEEQEVRRRSSTKKPTRAATSDTHAVPPPQPVPEVAQ